MTGWRRGGVRRAGRTALAGTALLTAAAVYGAVVQQPAKAPDMAVELARPDVATWPTIGSTMRVAAAKPTIPEQLRQVQMDPAGFERFVKTRVFDDGTRFSVLFHSVSLDTSHAPPLYHAAKEVAFALEVIDRGHPDGHRFYLFPAGVERAKPLPPGNECAVCHRARGTFDGTFAHLYPLITRYVAVRSDAAPKR